MAVNIHEAKTNLSRLIERVEEGEEIVIARAGRPVAKLVPYRKPRKPRRFGALKGEIWLARDWDSATVNREIEELFHASDPLLEDDE